MIEFAVEMGAGRIEIAHVQYYAWALLNRGALMPTREAFMTAAHQVEEARENTRASSSSTPSCPTITPSSRSPAWAAGHAASSTSRRRGACCPATPPRASRACRSTTSRRGAGRHLAQRRGLPEVSRHQLDEGALPLLPAQGDRLRRLPLPGVRTDAETPPTPIPPARSRRCMPGGPVAEVESHSPTPDSSTAAWAAPSPKCAPPSPLTVNLSRTASRHRSFMQTPVRQNVHAGFR